MIKTKSNSTKTRQLYGLLLAGLILLSLGCKKDPIIIAESDSTSTDSTSNNSIIGEWEWIKTIHSWSQPNTNPSTEGYSLTLKFKTNNTVENYKNDSLTDTYAYELKYWKNVPVNPNSDSTLVLVINNGTATSFSIENDTLILDQSYIDGPKKYYAWKD